MQAPHIEDVLELDWSFASLKRSETLWGPHGYHRYPAKFIPQLVRRIIELYSKPGDYIGDLFLGSGTTAVEAIRAKRKFLGSDVNPVALLISEAKSNVIEPDRLTSVSQVFIEQVASLPSIGRRKLTQKEQDFIVSFDLRGASWQERINYWFPEAHKDVLEQILLQIIEIEEAEIKLFFLCAFSNILRRCSIWLSGSTKPQKDLSASISDPVQEFQKQLRSMAKGNNLYWNDLVNSEINPRTIRNDFEICLQDTRHSGLEDASFDLIVTSPPYATCYDYRQLHQLTELWFEKFDLIESIDNQQSWIGIKESGSRSDQEVHLDKGTGSSTADEILHQLEVISSNGVDGARSEARALRNYFIDMCQVIHEFYRLTAPNKRVALVIGDSYKRGVHIPTSDILEEMGKKVGFELENRILRKVPGRVLVSKRDKETGRFSSTAESDTEVYPEEYILVFRKA